ncbi:MAG: prepilin peptidase [Theionarchaea archaeon]|nr:prepilin peptidase [Theionarchaea archaeon]MBU7001846.1 prepilin peptidase [Theionarchaea archaeon]MBU7020950.1 prepilin peptidase [Theionarchaea archaeon]MBU7034003.1 prepilin peptidase [Theionarchaea archaeon]MBU7041043.1 prepilin peptidase [Theionarchaea archaeon]
MLPITPILTVGFLLCGSYYDVKIREIPDSLWLVMGASGIVFRLWDSEWRLMGFGVAVACGLAFVLAISGLFGGADIKALVALSLLVPTYPGVASPLFVISVFNNLAVIKVLEVGAVFSYNVVTKNRYQGEISWWKKILLYMTGFPRSREALDYRFLPLQDETGNLHLMPDIDMDVERFKETCNQDRIWVTYGSPLILYMLLGSLVAFLKGDLVLQLFLHFLG